MIKPKKSLGQNFLRDKKVLDKIIQAADLKADDFVLEIGPGEGVLTEELIKYAGKVLAIEIDNNLAQRLDSRLHGNNKVKIINEDILKINLPETLLAQRGDSISGTGDTISNLRYKVIANIPYYITSPIIQLFLETKYPPTEMILMVQKEVAERIVAKPGQMSILAVSVQYYAKAELLFYVDRKSFWPVPEVDSAVIKITPYAQHTPSPQPSQPHPPRITGAPSPYKGEGVKNFFRIVKAGFSAKRKLLLNNLSNSLHLEKRIVEEKLKKSGIEPTQRAQELSVEEWKNITREISAN